MIKLDHEQGVSAKPGQRIVPMRDLMQVDARQPRPQGLLPQTMNWNSRTLLPLATTISLTMRSGLIPSCEDLSCQKRVALPDFKPKLKMMFSYTSIRNLIQVTTSPLDCQRCRPRHSAAESTALGSNQRPNPSPTQHLKPGTSKPKPPNPEPQYEVTSS